jgi:hypothetical protein
MERIEGSRLRRRQGLRFQTRLFGHNADEVGIIFDEALEVNSVAGQNAAHILLRNAVTGWQ